MQVNHKKLILVIDDSVDSQILLRLLLESKGYEVHTALNGVEALSLLKELSRLPDIILLDAQMPVMGGYQFRFEQGQNARLKDIPVIVMSGDVDEDIDLKMMYPEAVLVKPLNMKSLVESIELNLR